MARQLRVLAVLQRTCIQFPEPVLGSSQVPITPVPGEDASSSLSLHKGHFLQRSFSDPPEGVLLRDSAPQTGVHLVHTQCEGVWPGSIRSHGDMSNYVGNFFLARKEKMIRGDDSYKMRCKPRGEFFSLRTHPDSVRTVHLRNKCLHRAQPPFHPTHSMCHW